MDHAAQQSLRFQAGIFLNYAARDAIDQISDLGI